MRPPAPASALVLLALVLAGCAQPAATGPHAAAAPAVQIAADRPEVSFGRVETGPEAAPDLNATTDAAPRLVRGEWWRIRFESGFVHEVVPELVRVVADVTPEGYVVGMPHEGWMKEAIILHAPAFGDVGRDLSYAVHNVRFEPLRFPLKQGASWTTRFAGSNYTATVEKADAFTATIRFDPPASDPSPTDVAMAALSPISMDGTMRLVYDARQHEVVRLESAMGAWEVVAHGYGYEGWVTVPRAEHTAIDHGQFLAATPGDPALARTVNVSGGYNRMTLVQAIIALGPGAYRVRAVSPNGTEYVTESVAQKGITMRFYEASRPDGDWTIEDVVGGPGATYTMGMAYHQYDIRLPDGAIRSDHSHPVVR